MHSTSDHDRVFELTSRMLDGGLNDGQAGELDGMLRSSRDARRAYIENVQMHVMLTDHFAPPSNRFLSELDAAGPVPRLPDIESAPRRRPGLAS